MRNPQPARADRDLAAADSDLDVEPEELLCPITRTMFRDPVMVVESGHTYERSVILARWRRTYLGHRTKRVRSRSKPLIVAACLAHVPHHPRLSIERYRHAQIEAEDGDEAADDRA